MALTFYSLARLRELAKAAIRSHPAAANANLADGSDLSLVVEAAAFLFQGAQVAAQHVREQLFPRSADANNRERMLSEHGVDFTKPATKARGYIVVGHSSNSLYGHQVKKGTTFEFPEDAFPDGIARTFVAIEDCTFRDSGDHWVSGLAGIGGSLSKLRTRTISLRRGDVFGRAVGGGQVAFSVVRSANIASRHVDLFWPLSIQVADGETITEDTKKMMVAVECDTAGVQGNCMGFFLTPPGGSSDMATIVSSDSAINIGAVVEMAGGGDELGAIDPDEDRVVRVLEDTIAGAPSGGNPQHWREIALACPDVALDDAVIYSGVRGPGTIDIVAIGHSGQTRPSGFDKVNVEHLALGHNRRRIGDLQADIVEKWCRYNADGTQRTSYFDDIKVHSVEWDWRGRHSNHYSDSAFLRSSNSLIVTVQALPGYGPDCGEAVVVTPYTPVAGVNFSRLYASSASGRVADSLRVGHRVEVVIMSPSSVQASLTYPFATVVTEIIGFDYDRRYAIVTDLTPIARMVCPLARDATIYQWRSAGPLEQGVDDAVHAYFDSLGPGSYSAVPFDPGLQLTYAGAGVVMRPVPGIQVDRWPDEGRRWSGAFRQSALMAKIHAVKGVKNATVTTLGGGSLIDMDPAPLQTLRLSGVITAVTP